MIFGAPNQTSDRRFYGVSSEKFCDFNVIKLPEVRKKRRRIYCKFRDETYFCIYRQIANHRKGYAELMNIHKETLKKFIAIP